MSLQKDAVGIVPGPYAPETMVCQYVQISKFRGFWFGDDPLNFFLPLLLVQIVLIVLTTRFLFHFLKPFQQSILTAQVLAGIILGPSFLGHNKSYLKELFPIGGKVTLQTLANLGFILHFFVLGVQMDARILRKAGRNAVVMGTMGFVLPYALGGLTFFSLNGFMTLPQSLTVSLPFIVGVNSLSAFPVIASLLTDLKLLNSDLGRLAINTSMISDLCSMIVSAIMNSVGVSMHNSKWIPVWSIASFAVFLVAVVFILRPFIIWLTKHTPAGKPLDETHFFAILSILLVCALCAEIIGIHAAVGAFFLGLSIPDGPPLGTSLVQKIDSMATGILLPIFFAISGLQTDFFHLGQGTSLGIIEFIIIMGYMAKFAGIFVPALYFRVPFWDAFCLALIMCCKGSVEVATYIMWKDRKILTTQSFNLLIITMLIITGIARPLVNYLYDPSKRYMVNNRRTILDTKENIQLRILVCIHNADNVSTIINLLEVSNPTRFNPISIFALHLMQLTGRSSAVLVPHHNLNKLTKNATHSDHILNAFNHFEQQHQGSAIMQHFTAIAPYASMHDDICTLALDKRTDIVIVPFHKQWEIDGRVGNSTPSIRTVNCNVLNKAPCSVGVLIDRGMISGSRSVLMGQSMYCIALLYVGGNDDWEALAYSKRMVEHPKVSLTVIRFKHDNEKNLDKEVINDFRVKSENKDRINYKEETVRDAVETTQVIRSLGNAFELVIVGMHHDPQSPILFGLTDWSECPELGFLGDMLASSDFRFSVLVVQQQPLGAGFVDHSIKLPFIATGRSVSSTVSSEESLEEDCTPVYRVDQCRGST